MSRRRHRQRDRNPADGRSFVVRLTPAGRRAHRAAGKAFPSVLDQVVAALEDDEAGVRRALATLRIAVDEIEPTPDD